MEDKPRGTFEKVFEWALWKTRFITIIIVFSSIIAATYIMILASYEVYYTVTMISPFNIEAYKLGVPLSNLIGAVDLYLIGIVFLLFGFGVYELFVSKLEVAERNDSGSLLDINNLDDLKNKLLKVIVMALIVWFFKKILLLDMATSLDVLYFSIAILAVAVSVMLIRRRDG